MIKHFAIMLFASAFLSACLAPRKYTEYNYEPNYKHTGEISFSVTLIGKSRVLPSESSDEILIRESRESPYEIRMEFLDPSSKFSTARVLSAELIGKDSGEITTLNFGPDTRKFWTKRENKQSRLASIGFEASKVEMNKEDYTLKIIGEFCKPSGCIQQDLRATLVLNLNKFTRQ